MSVALYIRALWHSFILFFILRGFFHFKNIGTLFCDYYCHFILPFLLTLIYFGEIISTTYFDIFGYYYCFSIRVVKATSKLFGLRLYLPSWMIEANIKMIALNDAYYHLWNGKMKYLLFVKKLHLPVFATKKLNFIFDEEWDFEHQQLCGFIR